MDGCKGHGATAEVQGLKLHATSYAFSEKVNAPCDSLVLHVIVVLHARIASCNSPPASGSTLASSRVRPLQRATAAASQPVTREGAPALGATAAPLRRGCVLAPRVTGSAARLHQCCVRWNAQP